jgi:predicted O-methyltransferase YrrM
MKRRDIFTGVALAAGSAALGHAWLQRRSDRVNVAMAKDEIERGILQVIDEMDRRNRTYLSVPPVDGRCLRVMAEAMGAKNIVEVGTSTGYSGLWLALALKRTGGQLTTFEIDNGRAQTAREHFRQAGVDGQITVVVGDAHEKVKTVAGPIDLVFIDADKDGYPDYLDQLEPRVRPGGLILAHNVESSRAYIDKVTTNPRLETVFYMEVNDLGVTLKKL